MIGDYAIIPVREFSSAKQRLTNRLTSEERKALASALLKRVVRAAERSELECVIVVASDKSEISALIEGSRKISVISEKEYHGGVNGAFETGISYAIGRGARRIALFPSDLPFVSHAKIDEAISLLENHDLILNPSIKKDGTNLLVMNSDLTFELHYDDDSFNKHSLEAISRKLDFLVLDWKEFSIDLDDTDDLERTMRIFKSENFENLFKRISEGKI